MLQSVGVNVYIVKCKVISKRDDVYRVIKAFTTKGEWINPEAERYVQCLVRISFHILTLIIS